MNSAIVLFITLSPLFYLQSSLWESLFHEYFLDVRPWRRVSRYEKSKWLRARWFGAFEHGNVHHYLTYAHDYTQRFRSPEDEKKLIAILSRRLSAKELKSLQACQYGASVTWYGARYFLFPFYVNFLWLNIADGYADAIAIIAANLLFGLPFLLCSMIVHPYLHMRYDEAQARAPWPMRVFLRTRYGLAIRVLHYVHHRVPTRNYCLQIGADILRGRWLPPTEKDWEHMLHLQLITAQHREVLERRPVLGHPFVNCGTQVQES